MYEVPVYVFYDRGIVDELRSTNPDQHSQIEKYSLLDIIDQYQSSNVSNCKLRQCSTFSKGTPKLGQHHCQFEAMIETWT